MHKGRTLVEQPAVTHVGYRAVAAGPAGGAVHMHAHPQPEFARQGDIGGGGVHGGHLRPAQAQRHTFVAQLGAHAPDLGGDVRFTGGARAVAEHRMAGRLTQRLDRGVGVLRAVGAVEPVEHGRDP
ncbi:hypothetical protein ACFRNT_09930 [Streptomyces sp. NPDC056697]|uniref:hypothetical protein n=1 Tax=Streptomyces sp. NPDC056697 TaxID=3345915 RepID=UPI0036AF1CBA